MEHLDDYTAACPKCDRNRYLIDCDRDFTRATICEECFDECPACDGQEYQYVRDERGYEIAQQCPVCGALNRRIRAFNEAAIPRRHRDATLENFKTSAPGDGGKKGEPIGNLNRVRFRLYNWVKGFTPGERGFLLHGHVGTGKTHLLAGTIRHLALEKGISAQFVEFTHLLSELRQQFDQGRGETSILAPIIDIPVLAIDELGKGRNTNWQLSIIDEIISKRYNRSLTTLFTTNYPLDEASSPSGDSTSGDFHHSASTQTLEQRVGARVYSRLFDMADFVEIEAPDYRRR